MNHPSKIIDLRERIGLLVDPGSFVEIDTGVVSRCTGFNMNQHRVRGDGVITGWGNILGRKVYIFAYDATIHQGALGEAGAEKICKIMDLALSNGKPLIGLYDSTGARIQDGVAALAGQADIFYRHVKASGVIPQISAILGPCTGDVVYSPALTDFILMVDKNSHMVLNKPEADVPLTVEELGGAHIHAAVSGVSHLTCDSEPACFDYIKALLHFLPANNQEQPPLGPTSDFATRHIPKLNSIVPDRPNRPYDMLKVIQQIVDDGYFLEIQADFARNIIVGFGHLDGQTIGIIANQPKCLAGVLDIKASVKAARFIRFCDAFNIPLVTLVDVPGFLPGSEQEKGGIILRGAKLVYAYAEATVPKITVITRKAYGGAYIVMCSKHFRGDFNFAWPTGEIAVMGAQGAVNIIFRQELQKALDRLEKIMEDYNETFSNPYVAAQRGYIDDVIEPSETRIKLIQALEMSKTKRMSGPKRKHGNIPL